MTVIPPTAAAVFALLKSAVNMKANMMMENPNSTISSRTMIKYEFVVENITKFTSKLPKMRKTICNGSAPE